MAVKWEERRRFPRIRLRAPVRYQTRGTPEFNNVMSDNVGLGGIGFINDKFIAPKTLVMLEMNILSRFLNPIGRIAWVSSLPRSDRYRLGVEFLELGPDVKKYLQDYIDMRRGIL